MFRLPRGGVVPGKRGGGTFRGPRSPTDEGALPDGRWRRRRRRRPRRGREMGREPELPEGVEPMVRRHEFLPDGVQMGGIELMDSTPGPCPVRVAQALIAKATAAAGGWESGSGSRGDARGPAGLSHPSPCVVSPSTEGRRREERSENPCASTRVLYDKNPARRDFRQKNKQKIERLRRSKASSWLGLNFARRSVIQATSGHPVFHAPLNPRNTLRRKNLLPANGPHEQNLSSIPWQGGPPHPELSTGRSWLSSW